MNKLHEFYAKNLELKYHDKVKYYLFLPQMRAYKCDELSELIHYSNGSIFDADGEFIVIETSSSFMKYKAMLETYEWLESMNNHPSLIDRCIVTIKPIDLRAYDEFLKGNYSKMYKDPYQLMKVYTSSGTELSKMRATRIIKVLSRAKDYQEFLEDYLNLSEGTLNNIELDGKIQSETCAS